MSGVQHQLDGDDRSPPPAAGPAGPARAEGELVAGKYVLVRYLARGGMAEVWLATHQALKTEVAIKFVGGPVARSAEHEHYALERFRFEAQISAHLAARTHNVVAVQDAGMHGDTPYLVMEYVPGRTLEAEVRAAGAIAPESFADILDDVADALGAAHALGIVHRDLKPSNILVAEVPDANGRRITKVADFGVAKAFRSALALDRPRETQRGELVGSPAFMSPEQIAGAEGLDGRADLWSLGVVAYEALTGRPCFQGNTLLDTFAAISVGRYTPPSTCLPTLPSGVDAWVARALAPDPAHRFASAAEMAAGFRSLMGRPARSARRRRFVATVVAAAAAGALVVGFLSWSTRDHAAGAPGASGADTTPSSPPRVAAPAPAPPPPGAPTALEPDELPDVVPPSARRAAATSATARASSAQPTPPNNPASPPRAAAADGRPKGPHTGKAINPSEIQ
jgi:serine/threonine-protein kinase